jgi:hypothetical protein
MLHQDFILRFGLGRHPREIRQMAAVAHALARPSQGFGMRRVRLIISEPESTNTKTRG